MTAITTPSGHLIHAHPLHAARMRPEDAAEQACFSRLAAEDREDEVMSRLHGAAMRQRLHMRNVEWAIREQAI